MASTINDVKLTRLKNLWNICWEELKQLYSIAEEFTKQLNPHLCDDDSETTILVEITKPVEITNIPVQSVYQTIFTTVSEPLHSGNL
jgi:hypothetical protein